MTSRVLTCDPRVESRVQRYVKDRSGSFHIHQLVGKLGSSVWESRRLFVTPTQIAVQCFATATSPVTSTIYALTAHTRISLREGDDKRSILAIQPGVVLHLSSENTLKRDVLVMVLRHWMYIPRPFLLSAVDHQFPPMFSYSNPPPLPPLCSREMISPTVLKSPPGPSLLPSSTQPLEPCPQPLECSAAVLSAAEGSAANHSDSLDTTAALSLPSDVPPALSAVECVQSAADAAASNVSSDSAGAHLPGAETESPTAAHRPCPAPQPSQVLTAACACTCTVLCLLT